MNPIYCEHPLFILHPNAKDNLFRYRKYLFHGHIELISEITLHDWALKFPYKLFSPKANKISYDNIDLFGIITDTGELLPLFMPVPCNKCVLCKEKKCREWSLRAVAETNYSDSCPLMITLTYAVQPEQGVVKKDCQDFLKRLRINLERKGYNNKLRYFLCAEYGKNTHKAHYHLILWNFPNTEFRFITRIKEFIHSAWKHGFVMVKFTNQGGIRYVMKYMRKDCIVPKGKNNIFFLSSRRGGGIGYRFALDNVKYYQEHPEVLTITLKDKYTGDIYESSIPQYYKTKFFPSLCHLISKDIKDILQRYDYCTYMRWHWQCIDKVGRNKVVRFSFIDEQIHKKYSFYTFCYALQRRSQKVMHKCLKFTKQDVSNLLDEIDSLTHFLYHLVLPDIDYYKEIKDIHNGFALMQNIEPLNVQYTSECISNRNYKSSLREVF